MDASPSAPAPPSASSTTSATSHRRTDGAGRSPKLQPIGRIALPAEAGGALGWSPGVTVEVWGLSSRLALVLRRDGSGAELRVDGRGRLYLPVWMRRTDAVLIGTGVDRSSVVVAPVGVLDGIGDLLVRDQG